MYQTAPARQPAPGTELVERYYGGFGFGSYVATEQYALTPAAASAIRGMGCAGLACAGMGCGCAKGVGAFGDGTGLLGSGLFVSSSPSDWGVGEYVALGLGAFVLFSVFDTGRRGVSTARRKGRAVRKALAA